MSVFTREYEKAIKQGDYKYQANILTNEINKLKNRQRSILRAEAKARQNGISQEIIDVAILPEFEKNKRYIEQLQNIREQTKERIKAERRGTELPSVQTATAVNIAKRLDLATKKLEKEIKKKSERSISSAIKRSESRAVEEVIRRMIYTGSFMQQPYMDLLALEQEYGWVFDYLGFRLSDKFKQDIAQNYSDYASDIAFDFFNNIDSQIKIDEAPSDETIDGEHTKADLIKAINDIVNAVKGKIKNG